jgi:hypothetical protein
MTVCKRPLADAREVIVVQLQLPDLMIGRECDAVSLDPATRVELIGLMARVVVAVFHAEGGSNDRSRIQSQDQTGALGSQGDCVPSAVQREISPTEYGKSTSAVCGSRTGTRSGLEAGGDHQ